MFFELFAYFTYKIVILLTLISTVEVNVCHQSGLVEATNLVALVSIMQNAETASKLK